MVRRERFARSRGGRQWLFRIGAKIRRKILEKTGNHLWVPVGRHNVLEELAEIGLHVRERIWREGGVIRGGKK